MKIKQPFLLLAVAMLHLRTGHAQSAPTTLTSSASAPASLSPGATEVVKLAQSGVGDDVVLSFIGQSHVYYKLAAADIVELKDAGVSSQVLSAMLNHDTALRTQQPSTPPSAATPASPPSAVTHWDASAPTTTANSPSATTVGIAPTPAPAPASPVEVVPVSPGPDYVWTPGWWSWNGGAWIWFGGYWGYPSRPGHVWINGHFYHGRGFGSVRGYRH